MSAADRLAAEAQEFLAHADSDYEVDIDHAGASYGWFYVRVYYRNQLIYGKPCCRSYTWTKWAVRRAVKKHKKFIDGLRSEGIRV